MRQTIPLLLLAACQSAPTEPVKSVRVEASGLRSVVVYVDRLE